MKNLHLLSELHLFHLFCYMRNLPFLIAFSFALIYQQKSFAFTIGIHHKDNNIVIEDLRNIKDIEILEVNKHYE